MRAYGLMIVLWGCGSSVVDVGELPEDSETGENGGGEGSGDSRGEGARNPDGSPCSIPDLAQYQLLFDSDGGKLERRIYSMRADGTEIEPITAVDELAREPALSPDGTELAYATPEGLKLFHMANQESELLMPDGDQPEWAPDGSRLAYRQFSSVTVMSMPDRTESFLNVCSGETCSYPDFAADNVTLVVSNSSSPDSSSEHSITTMIVDFGAGRIAVPVSNIVVTHPAISPDGIWLAAAFQCRSGDRSSLWVSPLNTTTAACEGRRVSRPGAEAATNPKWGPGVLIAFERGEPPRDIGIIAADTGQECYIEGPGDDRNPSWVASSFADPK
jgi:hypothetical protein